MNKIVKYNFYLSHVWERLFFLTISCAASYDSCSNCAGGTCTSSCISNCSGICIANGCESGCRYKSYTSCSDCTLTCIGSAYVYGCGNGCEGGCGSSNCQGSCLKGCKDYSGCDGLATIFLFKPYFSIILNI